MLSHNTAFITGTDTDVGKTIVAAALCRGLIAKDQQTHYWKPIQAGTDQPDANTLSQICGLHVWPSAQILQLPASPDQAQLHENVDGLSAQQILNRQPQAEGLMIWEGAGGLMVPINLHSESWLDVLHLGQLPSFLVARTSLGTLNHTLLSVSALQDRGLKLGGIILNGVRHCANEQSLRRLLPDVALHWFPQQDNPYAPDASDCDALADFFLKHVPCVDEPTVSKGMRACIWHPFTQHKHQQSPVVLQRAQGSFLFTDTGEKLLDTNASWWVNTIGHGRPEIRQAISRQQAKMDHVIFANAVHAPGARLTARLCELTQHKMQRVYYSDSGSTAVEIGLKMAFQAWKNRGEKLRNKFLALKSGYHGDTFGAMSVGGSGHFHGTFAALMFESQLVAPVTSHSSEPCPEGVAAKERYLAAFEQHLNQQHHHYAGIILEPMVQGAGGMLVQDVDWLQRIVALCRAHNLYVIYDEVFTGLGRVGDAFACLRSQTDPDIICLAKGLTGGTLPLAATLAKESIFQEFYDDEVDKALLHGHSYTGNPIACAAALATLNIFHEEQLDHCAYQIEQHFKRWLSDTAPQLPVKHGRCLGAVLAMELEGDDTHSNYFAKRARQIPALGKKHGLFLRPLGNTVYFVPPLTITKAELEFGLDGIAATLRDLDE